MGLKEHSFDDEGFIVGAEVRLNTYGGKLLFQRRRYAVRKYMLYSTWRITSIFRMKFGPSWVELEPHTTPTHIPMPNAIAQELQEFNGHIRTTLTRLRSRWELVMPDGSEEAPEQDMSCTCSMRHVLTFGFEADCPYHSRRSN